MFVFLTYFAVANNISSTFFSGDELIQFALYEGAVKFYGLDDECLRRFWYMTYQVIHNNIVDESKY